MISIPAALCRLRRGGYSRARNGQSFHEFLSLFDSDNEVPGVGTELEIYSLIFHF